MGIVGWRRGTRRLVRGTAQSRFAASLKEPTPGNNPLARGCVKEDINESRATKDAGACVDTCQSPFLAGKLAETGDAKGHCETNVGDGVGKECEGDLLHSFVGAFGFRHHVVATFDGSGAFFGGDGDGLGLKDGFGVGGGLGVGTASLEIGLPAGKFVRASLYFGA